MFLVTYPDYLEKDVTVILHNIDNEKKKALLPILFDNLPDDAVIVLSENQIDWAKKFQNGYWFLQNIELDFVDLDHQLNIKNSDMIPELCVELFNKINI